MLFLQVFLRSLSAFCRAEATVKISDVHDVLGILGLKIGRLDVSQAMLKKICWMAFLW